MTIQKLRPSFTFTQDRLAELQAAIPEAFADGKIDWDVLKGALGAFLEDEGPDAEHFGLFWPGKRDARRLATKPSKGTLKPAPGEGVYEDATGNIFIEGDNLEVLKILQKSYAGRIKMIYIDPPYNTGNDFVYKDDYADPLERYLEVTGQKDGAGNLLTSNPETSGRYHSAWLSMMYPRLYIARQLLSDDGVIFISIDDHETHNLRFLLNEIFGEENFVAELTLLCNPKGRAQDKFFATNHEYILVFSKNILPKGSFNIEKERAQIENEYREEDEGGKFRTLELRNTHREFGKHNRPNLYYPLYVNIATGEVQLSPSENSVEVFPNWEDGFQGCWTWGLPKAEDDIDFLIGRFVSGKWKIYVKDYAIGSSKMLKTILIDNSYFTEKGQKTFNALFNSKNKIFQSPKSVELIMQFCRTSTRENDIILDFFAGSCTTAQAVLELNREDGGNRHFICVQLAESTPVQSEARKAGYDTIAEVGKERVRRVIANMQQIAQAKLIKQDHEEPEDLGFKVFKLNHSNFKAWQDYQGEDVQELETLFDGIETPLFEGWSEAGLLTEILLMQGFPLDSTITQEDEFKQNNIQLVDSDAYTHRLFVCLDDRINDDTIAQLQLRAEDVFVCLDSALTDQSKMRLADICNLNII